MISGTKFSLRLEAIKLGVYAPEIVIKREHRELPILEYEFGILAVLASINGAILTAKVLAKEMKMIDVYRREPEKVS
jgi:hypothetical protein